MPKAEELAKLFKSIKTKPLYRYISEGKLEKVRPKLNYNPITTTLTEEEPVGLYLGHSIKDLPSLIEPDAITSGTIRGTIENLTEGPVKEATKKIAKVKLLPEAKVLNINNKKEWRQILSEFRSEVKVESSSPLGWSEDAKAKRDALTQWLKGKGFDAVRFPDVAGDQEHLFQTVILNPNKAIGKLGKKYKLLGVAGVTASAGLLGSEVQAEEPTKRLRPGSGMAFDSFTPKIDIPARTTEDDPWVGLAPGRKLRPGAGFASGEQPSGASMPQDQSTVGKIWDYVKENGIDIAGNLAIFAGSTAVAAATGVTGIGLPITAGAITTAAMAAQQLLAGKKPTEEPTLTETGLGYLGLPVSAPEVARPFIETAENALFLKSLAKPVKGLLKGVQVVPKPTTVGPIREAIWENVFVKPTNLKIPYTGKTIRETFQPAIERLRADQPRVERSIQKAKVQQALSREVIANALKEVEKTFLPSEKLEFMKGLTPKYPIQSLTSSKAKDLLYRTDKALSKTAERDFKSTLLEDLSKGFTKQLESVESSGVLPSTLSGLLKGLERPLVGKASIKIKEVNAVLDKIIQNPRYTPEIQQFAKDMINLSAQTPLEVAKALTHSSDEYIISKLMKNPGVVSSVVKPGYVSSTHPSIKGLFVAKDINLELEAMRRIPQIANQWSNKWFMGPWKTNKVVLRPAAHARNLFGNLFANDVYGGMNAFDPRNWVTYGKGLLDVYNKGPHTREFTKLTGMVGRWGKEEMDQMVPALRYGATVFDKGLHLYDTIAAPARGLYAAEEAWFKVSKFIFNKEQGMKPLEAAYDAMRCTLNYSEVTPAIAKLRSAWWGAPFATWQSKIIPMTVEAAVKHPLRLGKWVGLGLYLQNYALNAVGVTDDEWESVKGVMPEYMKKGMYLLMPWRDEKQQLKMMNLTWLIPGIGDLSELYQKGADNPLLALIQNPVVGTITTLQSKKKFSGAPLYYDWEHPTTKAAKTLGFMWEMWSPAPMPGNIDWRTLQDSIQEQPGALSPEEAVASQLGLKLTTVNPTQMKRRSETLRRIHETEISTEMRRELKRTKNPKEISEILDKYRKLRLEQREP